MRQPKFKLGELVIIKVKNGYGYNHEQKKIVAARLSDFGWVYNFKGSNSNYAEDELIKIES